MKRILVVLMIALTGAAFTAEAKDVLKLKDGSVIKGELIEGSSNQIKFKDSDGSVWVFGVEEVLSMQREPQPENETLQKKEGRKEFSKRGYRTQIEYVAETGDFSAVGVDVVFDYQFNSHLQLGGGAGLRSLEEMYDGGGAPLYVDFRVNILKTKVTPFFDLKAGTFLFLKKWGASPYVSPTAGIKIHFSKARALSFLLGGAFAEVCKESVSGLHNLEEKAVVKRKEYIGKAFSFKLNYQF
ncbi:MAG: hypothetical protein J6Q03_05030 [Paludibacteraceae bacterium]|nr:hypothetical protein [Paludibacteraceae bacterium]